MKYLTTAIYLASWVYLVIVGVAGMLCAVTMATAGNIKRTWRT